MKQETYIKISEFVRKYPHGESIVKYANNIITGVVYMAYFVIYNIITEFYTASSNTTYFLQ